MNKHNQEAAVYFRKMYTRLTKIHPLVKASDKGICFLMFSAWGVPEGREYLQKGESRRIKVLCALLKKMVAKYPSSGYEVAVAGLNVLPRDLITEKIVYTRGYLEGVKHVYEENIII